MYKESRVGGWGLIQGSIWAIICMEFRGKRGQGLGKGLWGEVCVWWGEVGYFSLTSVDATALFLLFLYIYIFF